MADTIYLDNNATTRPLDRVVEAMLPFLRQQYANPSSVHQFGQSVRYRLECARQDVARLVQAQPSEIVFTSSGTESINLAIRGTLAAIPSKKHVIVTTVEHSAVRSLGAQLTREGFRVDEIGVDHDGRLNYEELESKISDSTALVSVMHANNETGVLFDAPRICAIAERRGVRVHLDAVQSAGKVPIDVKTLPVHLLSLSAHKLHGPKGAGALFVRKKTRLAPLLVGGTQERDLRAGTENVAGIIGFAVASRAAAELAPETIGAIRNLRDALETRVMATIPSAHVNGRAAERVCNTTNIGFQGLESEAILILLSESGISASAGSACSSGLLEPSHVLRAMGIDSKIAHGAVRFSLSQFTTQAEIDRTVEVVKEVVAHLAPLRPFNPQSAIRNPQ